MRLIRAKDYNDVSRKAANIIAAQIYLKPDCAYSLRFVLGLICAKI